jgi:hypothetical protein
MGPENPRGEMNEIARAVAAAARPASSPKPRRTPVLPQLRKLHAYVGMLIAPATIFFAATGILQIYGLHEAHPGYAPAPIVEKLGVLHKEQAYKLGRHGGAPRPEGPAPAAQPPRGAAKGDVAEGVPDALSIQLLKAFFAVVAAGLIFSTVTGVWMALLQPLRRKTYLALLLLGALVPAILAALSA